MRLRGWFQALRPCNHRGVSIHSIGAVLVF